MFRARRQADFSTWQSPGNGFTVVYSEAALRLIVERSLDALHSIPGRGMETGGVLFGTADQDEVRITVSRPIKCSHAFGPGWILNEDEESELAANVEEYADDPELSGLIPVGFYASHTRGEIAMSEGERTLFHRYFPNPYDVALILRPEHGKATRAGFFMRNIYGGLPEGPCADEFIAAPASESGIRAMTPTQRREHGLEKPPHIFVLPEPATVVPAVPEPEILRPPEELLDRPKESHFHWKVPFALAVVAAGAAGAFFLWHSPAPPTAEATLQLRLQERNGALVALWDGQSPLLKNVTSAVLEINDGTERRIALNQSLIESGEWPLVTSSRKVAAKFRIGGRDVIDTARFTGPSATNVAPAHPAEEGNLLKLRREVDARQFQLQAQLQENDNLESRVETLRELVRLRLSPSGARSANAVPAAPLPKQKQNTPELLPAPPPTANQSTVAPVAGALPQSLPQEPARPPAPVERPAPQFTDRAPVRQPQPPPPAETPKQPAYSGPTSGRLLWMGTVAAGGSITIDNRRVSSGSLLGALPGVPVRIGAYPMELGPQGLTVWSASPRHASGPVTEEPSARNGWQRTTHRYDPRRASEIVVAEPPSAANNWNRVLLRGGRSPINAILIEWEVVQP